MVVFPWFSWYKKTLPIAHKQIEIKPVIFVILDIFSIVYLNLHKDNDFEL